MADSVGYNVLLGVQTILQSASLIGILSESILVRELPKIGEVLDTVPAVLIAPFREIESEPLDMEGTANRIYHVEISLVDGAEGDFATDQQKQQTWHEQIYGAIEKNNDGSWRLGLASVESIWSIQPADIQTFDRSELNENYAYLSMVYKFYSHE